MAIVQPGVLTDLLILKQEYFVLWRPGITDPAPQLVIGTFQAGNPPTLAGSRVFDLRPLAGEKDLWGIAANDCQLQTGTVYHYWFEVTDTDPYTATHHRLRCTDPTAWTVDWRLLSQQQPLISQREIDNYPAGVVLFREGRLEACDPAGEQADWNGEPGPEQLPVNSRLVLYELPTNWARKGLEGNIEIGIGTFRDVLALIDHEALPVNFKGLRAGEAGRAHILDLGINALELLPPADSYQDREWGYGTSNYFAADFDLGMPEGFSSPTATTDLIRLIRTCHQYGLRVLADMVMAFATRCPLRTTNFLDFFVQIGTGDPEETVNGMRRDGFGGDLFKYNYWTETYNPTDSQVERLVPARSYLYTYLKHWMQFYHIDGIRIDSVPNIGNWDFIEEFTKRAHQFWQEGWPAGSATNQADERFLVIGEALDMPLGLLTQRRLDSLWNEPFKHLLRSVILGQNDPSEPSFEWCVRKLIDCRLLGFNNGSQAINYLTSHDTGGWRSERLYSFLQNNHIVETEQRIKLAFVCLLTAVGIPMILAGEEFADQNDVAEDSESKQLDPVNFERVEDPWRKRLYQYVGTLIALRKESPALSGDEVSFLHVDFNNAKRVVVWLRGQPGSPEMVVVVANFSDYGTPNPFSGVSEYVVPNWPALPEGMHWQEVTQQRQVPAEWAGREPIFPWEAKVYRAQAY